MAEFEKLRLQKYRDWYATQRISSTGVTTGTTNWVPAGHRDIYALCDALEALVDLIFSMRSQIGIDLKSIVDKNLQEIMDKL